MMRLRAEGTVALSVVTSLSTPRSSTLPLLKPSDSKTEICLESIIFSMGLSSIKKAFRPLASVSCRQRSTQNRQRFTDGKVGRYSPQTWTM
jgi:hypothetical protein